MSFEHSTRPLSRIPFHTAEGEALLKKVEAHWAAKRSFGSIPSQADLAPEPLNDALSYCFILERLSPTIARFRVAGQGLNDLLRLEARGMPLSAIFTPEGRAQLGPIINSVCEVPEIVEIPVTASRGIIGGPLRGRGTQRLSPVIRTIAENAPPAPAPQYVQRLRDVEPTMPAMPDTLPTRGARRTYLRLVVDNT